MWGVAVAAAEVVAAALALLLLLLLLEDEEVVEVLIDMRFGGLRGKKIKYFIPSQDEFRFFRAKGVNVTFPIFSIPRRERRRLLLRSVDGAVTVPVAGGRCGRRRRRRELADRGGAALEARVAGGIAAAAAVVVVVAVADVAAVGAASPAVVGRLH